MRDAVSNLGLTEAMRAALKLLDVDYDEIAELEADAALGNGGLGRLAACFMESMATVGVPAYGYGIRYRHGLFRQEIVDGNQVELPETWLEHGNPWEFDRREAAYDIGFGGRVEYHDPNGAEERYVWLPAEQVKATAYDTPIVGWRGGAGEHAPALEGRPDRPDPPRRLQRRRPRRQPRREQPRRRADPRALPGRHLARRARSCGSGRSISSPPPRCRTSCAGTCSSTAGSTTSPTRWRSSSTTPTRRSASPS